MRSIGHRVPCISTLSSSYQILCKRTSRTSRCQVVEVMAVEGPGPDC